MAADRGCINLPTIDNDATYDAMLGKGLHVSTKLECGQTLARHALEELGPKSVLVQVSTDHGGARGSGFFVGKDGDMIITNAHVVADAREANVETVSGEVFGTRIVDLDEINDLAVLKVVGIKKDPHRSVSFGDDTKLKSGDPLLAVGHPGGNEAPVVSDGSYIENGPIVLHLQSDNARRLMESAANFSAHNPSYAKDAKDNLFADQIGMDTPLWHGSSGGAVANEHNKVVGVSVAIDAENPYMSMAVPISRATDLLNRKQPKFNFVYESQSEFNRAPVSTTVVDAIELGAAYGLRKFAAPVLGAVNGLEAYDNLSLASQKDIFRSRTKYLEAAGENIVGAVGGVMSLIPRTRAIGFGLVGAKLLLDVGRDFLPDTAIIKEVKRTDGDQRLPFGWDGKMY